MTATDKYERMNQAREKLMAVAMDDNLADAYAAACFTLGLLDDLVGPHKLDLDAAEDFQDRLAEDEEAMAAYNEGRGVS